MDALLHGLGRAVAAVAASFVAAVRAVCADLYAQVVVFVRKDAVHELCAVAHYLEEGRAQKIYEVALKELIYKVALYLYGKSSAFELERLDVREPSREGCFGDIVTNDLQTFVPLCIKQ